MARKTIKAKGLNGMPGPQSLAVKADNWVFTSGFARERAAATKDELLSEALQVWMMSPARSTPLMPGSTTSQNCAPTPVTRAFLQ